MKKVLITGGSGYIGSHIAYDLLTQGYEVIIVDRKQPNHRLKDKFEPYFRSRKLSYLITDLLGVMNSNHTQLRGIRVNSVIHCAGYKLVDESIKVPSKYYSNNINSTLEAFNLALTLGAKSFIFSSSASVYGDSKLPSISEKHPKSPQSPYARTKVICEEMLNDMSNQYPHISIISLRYFNPVGSLLNPDSSGSLFTHLINSHNLKSNMFYINGIDYDTKDGSPIRDFIDIRDLSNSHIECIKYCDQLQFPINEIFNVGTGKFTSVLDIVSLFKMKFKSQFRIGVKDRRVGDVRGNSADVTKIRQIIGWESKYSIDDSIELLHKGS